MPIECDIWPMSILTRASGEKDRKLLVHPKECIKRSGIRRNEEDKLKIVEERAIKIKPGTYFIEEKEQGHRHFYCRDADGVYHIYGRRLNVNRTYSDLMQKLRGVPLPTLPKETVVDMELIWPGHKDAEVATAIKNCPEELRMKAFALPIYEGKNQMLNNSLSVEEGREQLIETVGEDNVCTLRGSVELSDDNKVLELECMLRMIEEDEIEGFVLKEKSCDGWWKLKGINECDVFVVGFEISVAETKAGLVTRVYVACTNENGEVVGMGKVAGFNNEEELNLTRAYSDYGHSLENPYMFRTLRVVYQEVASRGKMKHGYFDGWRDDKAWNSCSIEQFELTENDIPTVLEIITPEV